MARATKDGLVPPAVAREGGGAKAKKNRGGKGGRTKKPRVTALSIQRRENMNTALGFRAQSYTYQQIADEMKVSKATAYRWCAEALAEIPQEKADEVRTIVITRLDLMTSKMMEQFLQDPSQVHIAEMVIKLDAQRARLLGLYRNEESNSDKVFKAMGDRMAELLKADPPILHIEAGTPIPRNPIL